MLGVIRSLFAGMTQTGGNPFSFTLHDTFILANMMLRPCLISIPIVASESIECCESLVVVVVSKSLSMLTLLVAERTTCFAVTLR